MTIVHGIFDYFNHKGDIEKLAAEQCPVGRNIYSIDEQVLAEKKRGHYKRAIDSYELASAQMHEYLSEQEENNFIQKIDQTYQELNILEHDMWYFEYEMTQNPRKMQFASKRPRGVLPPSFINSNLVEIDEWLRYGECPPVELITEALKSTTGDAEAKRIVVCAALLDNKTLLEEQINHHYYGDYSAYKGQKSIGLNSEDREPRPSFYRSARFVRSFAENYLEQWRSILSLDISNWMEATINELSRNV